MFANNSAKCSDLQADESQLTEVGRPEQCNSFQFWDTAKWINTGKTSEARMYLQ